MARAEHTGNRRRLSSRRDRGYAGGGRLAVKPDSVAPPSRFVFSLSLSLPLPLAAFFSRTRREHEGCAEFDIARSLFLLSTSLYIKEKRQRVTEDAKRLAPLNHWHCRNEYEKTRSRDGSS